MILIVDSGSTKCDWIAIDNKGNHLLEKIRTKGLNPAIISQTKINAILSESAPLSKHRGDVTHLYFYGAGCGTEKPRQMLKEALESFFSSATVQVNEDTMAAVYATINTPQEAAVVCILGTGSNCSYFDGKTLHQRVDSLGYTIMDDASGNYYGKALLRDYYFNHMPQDIKTAFAKKYDLEADVIKNNLYKQPNPNAYLAQFAEFMIVNKDAEYMQRLIKSGIRRFAENMIFQYKLELESVPVHFAGSIAYFCQDEIKAVAAHMGFMVGNVVRRPIDGLVKYHTV